MTLLRVHGKRYETGTGSGREPFQKKRECSRLACKMDKPKVLARFLCFSFGTRHSTELKASAPLGLNSQKRRTIVGGWNQCVDSINVPRPEAGTGHLQLLR